MGWLARRADPGHDGLVHDDDPIGNGERLILGRLPVQAEMLIVVSVEPWIGT